MGFLADMGDLVGPAIDGMRKEELAQQSRTDWQRGQKRADMQDQAAQAGLEDYQQKRADVAGNRKAFKDGGLAAVGPAAQQRGDIEGAQAAAGAKLKELLTQMDQTEAEARQLMQPDKIATQKIQAAGELARAPTEQTVATAQGDEKLRALRERHALDVYKLGHADPKAAVEAYNNSALKPPGPDITDFRIDPTNGAATLIGPDGNPVRTIPNQFFAGLQQKYNPAKLEKVKHDESLVTVDQQNNVTPRYTGPGLDSVAPIPEGTVGFYNKKTTAVTPLPAGLGSVNPKRAEATAAHRAALVTKATDSIKNALGGNMNMNMSATDADKLFTALGQRAGEYIDQGMPYEKAANAAYQDYVRQQALKRVAPTTDATSLPAARPLNGGAAVAPMSNSSAAPGTPDYWQSFVTP